MTAIKTNQKRHLRGVINLKIKLEPCYPEGSTRKEQLAYIKQEYEELMEAIKEKSWQEQAREALDLAQTCIGCLDIRGRRGCLIKKTGIDDLEDIQEAISRLIDYIHSGNTYCTVSDLYTAALDYFYNIVERHSRNNDKVLNDLIDRFLQEHEEKLQSRRKEWDHGGSGR